MVLFYLKFGITISICILHYNLIGYFIPILDNIEIFYQIIPMTIFFNMILLLIGSFFWLKGREYMMSDDTHLSAKGMCDRFIEDMDTAFEKWTPRNNFDLVEA